jgi:hypothetical protein
MDRAISVNGDVVTRVHLQISAGIDGQVMAFKVG